LRLRGRRGARRDPILLGAPGICRCGDGVPPDHDLRVSGLGQRGAGGGRRPAAPPPGQTPGGGRVPVARRRRPALRGPPRPARRAVALRGGRVAAVAESLASADAGEVVDATGALVTPGLIDLHAHVYDGALPIGIHADRAALVNGVTTVVDAGSAGWMTFAGL